MNFCSDFDIFSNSPFCLFFFEHLRSQSMGGSVCGRLRILVLWESYEEGHSLTVLGRRREKKEEFGIWFDLLCFDNMFSSTGRTYMLISI